MCVCVPFSPYSLIQSRFVWTFTGSILAGKWFIVYLKIFLYKFGAVGGKWKKIRRSTRKSARRGKKNNNNENLCRAMLMFQRSMKTTIPCSMEHTFVDFDVLSKLMLAKILMAFLHVELRCMWSILPSGWQRIIFLSLKKVSILETWFDLPHHWNAK